MDFDFDVDEDVDVDVNVDCPGPGRSVMMGGQRSRSSHAFSGFLGGRHGRATKRLFSFWAQLKPFCHLAMITFFFSFLVWATAGSGHLDAGHSHIMR